MVCVCVCVRVGLLSSARCFRNGRHTPDRRVVESAGVLTVRHDHHRAPHPLRWESSVIGVSFRRASDAHLLRRAERCSAERGTRCFSFCSGGQESFCRLVSSAPLLVVDKHIHRHGHTRTCIYANTPRRVMTPATSPLLHIRSFTGKERTNPDRRERGPQQRYAQYEGATPHARERERASQWARHKGERTSRPSCAHRAQRHGRQCTCEETKEKAKTKSER